MTRLYSFALLFFLMAAMIYGYIAWQSSSSSKQQTIDSELVPDFIAESLKSKMFNAQGDLSYIVNAQRMEHYTDLAITNFEYPNYTLFPKKNKSTWQVSADEGTLHGNNRVKLQNSVRLVANDKNSLIQEVQGKYLELDLKTNILSSAQAIKILGKGFTIDGSGLIVDLNSNQMTLTKHAQTIYEHTKK